MCEKYLSQKGVLEGKVERFGRKRTPERLGQLFISFIHSVPSKWYTMYLVLNLCIWRRHGLSPQDILHPFIISYIGAPSEQPLHDFTVDVNSTGTFPRGDCKSLPFFQAKT